MVRLRYDEFHWSREKDTEKALEQYLELSQRVFNKMMVNTFEKLIGDVTGKKVLDYGGGAGIISILCAKKGASVVLVDAERNALCGAILYSRKEGVEERVHTIHAETLPANLRSERFDIIVMKDVIEHIEDDQNLLIDLSDCQDEGGILLISTQNSFSLNFLLEGSYQKKRCGNSSWCGWDPTHLRFYTAASLKNKLIKAGYRPDKWMSIYIIPYNILSWFFLLKLNIHIPLLRYFDLVLGRLFPFNRTGWNFVVRARKFRK